MTTQAADSPSPLTAVLAAFGEGAESVAQVAAATGLSVELVQVAIDQLCDLGLIQRDVVASGCPEVACDGCGAPTGTGCASGPQARTGGLVTLTLQPRPGGIAPDDGPPTGASSQ